MITYPTPWVIPLASNNPFSEPPDVLQVGGKGDSLCRLAWAGFPVPDGFLLTTQAYRDFVTINGLDEQIQAILGEANEQDFSGLERVSTQIRSLFAGGNMPDELGREICAAYQSLGEPPVAVRSSATAEDLPDLSFAGQQDTYLNILGNQNLLKAVIDCWSSLWTARAIGYRLRNQIASQGLALGVVVQEMIPSQVSGVLFTANPLSGLRTEFVIDAIFGLGEVLVSGQVEPDHYVVNMVQRRICSKTLGAKHISLHGEAEGGTSRVEEDRRSVQALPDEQILALADLGQKIAAFYSSPQDIEWAWAKGGLHLLQSRPITSLYPTPTSMPPEPLKVMVSFAAVQGMLDPITPLGSDTLRMLFAMGASLFGYRLTSETQQALLPAGERLWINFTALVRNSIGRRAFYAALQWIEPTVRQELTGLMEDPRLQPERNGIRLQTLPHLARFFLPLAGNILQNMLFPSSRRKMIIRNAEQVLEEMRSQCAAVSGNRQQRLVQLANLYPDLAQQHLPNTLLLFVSGVATGMAAFNFLNLLTKGLPEDAGQMSWSDLVLEITRGLPNNPTTEMDLALWRVAQAIQKDLPSLQEFQSHSATELADLFQAGKISPIANQAIREFLQTYGARGLGEIDLGRKRWREQPVQVFKLLSGFLSIQAGDQAPDVVFARSVETAERASAKLIQRLRNTHHGWLKARIAKFFTVRVRQWMGIRESPKFFAVRMMGELRNELLKVGEDFVLAGELEQADDLMYLTFAELNGLAAGEGSNWQALIARRRESYQRELLRRQIPRLLISDGRAFYQGMNTLAGAEGILMGSPVSPGSVEGQVRVVLDPRQAGLLPGEILVCPGTDPSWTPLFLTAAGLVMEVGGMMTHGAVVAREYGIPAVVGVDRATTQLQNGQRIRLDGSSGRITIL